MSGGRWLVLDMDDGVLRREPSRRAAVAWFQGFTLTDTVRERHQYGPGAYEYIVGVAGGDPEENRGAFIERVDAARRGGWDVDQQPLYPHDGAERFTQADRDDAAQAAT